MSQNLTVVPTTAQPSGGASLTLPTEKTLLIKQTAIDLMERMS